MNEKMLKFVDINQENPSKRDKIERKVDFDEILNFHKIQKNYITVIASLKNIEVPYGVCKSKKNGDLIKIIEKPKKNYLVNTGFYIIKDKVLKLMPSNKKIDFNELINLVKKKKLKILKKSDRSLIFAKATQIINDEKKNK